MRKMETVVAFAILGIALTILSTPIWLDSAWPHIFSFMGAVKGLPAAIVSVLQSFAEFVMKKI